MLVNSTSPLNLYHLSDTYSASSFVVMGSVPKKCVSSKIRILEVRTKKQTE